MSPALTETRRRAITITLVEPYPLVRETLREILGQESDLRITAEVVAVEDAIAVVRDNPSDVVMVDTDLAIASLVPAIQQLRRECPTTAVIVVGHGRGDEELFRAIEAGAAAYVLDAARPAELVRTIRAVAGGEYVIDASVAARPEVARRVLEAFRSATLHGQGAGAGPSQRPFEPLSTREAQILTLISTGMANKDVAASLSISQHTVNNHVKAVLRKLAVNNRTQAVLLAIQRSWISVPEGQMQRPN